VRYYVDSSAYLAVLLGEQGHEALVAELDGAALLSSALLVLEAERNLIRFARERRISPADLDTLLRRLAEDVDVFQLRDLSPALGLTREMPMITTPRSLDLLHLRTALAFHREAPIDRFVSLDAHQTGAARELGLPV
jgi:hypothetical protein